jgi:hypothetical protein
MADSREEAVRRVECEVENNCGHEFYDDYEVQKELVRKVSDLSSAYLVEQYSRSQDILQRYREAAEEGKAEICVY